jgi:hypothetical protein
MRDSMNFMVKVRKPENILELGEVDISALKYLVARTSEQVWNLENERKENNFGVFHHTRHIVFRFIEGMRDHRQFYSNPIWDVWQENLLPVMHAASTKYNFSKPVFPKAMLARLAAGAVIDRHTDGAGSNLHTHKIHIPLQTNEKAIMFINDKPFHLRENHAYEVNNIVPHAVENLGTEDRIHLIFEVFDQVEKVSA